MKHRGNHSSQTSAGPTQIQPEERQQVENFLIEFHDSFARHRFDIGTNREFKVKMTHQHTTKACLHQVTSKTAS